MKIAEVKWTHRMYIQTTPLFSSAELKVQVNISDHLSSVCPSDCKLFAFYILFSRTTGPISNKHGTKHPWVKGIQDCSNKRSRIFPKGDNHEIAKIYWRNLKTKIFITTEPISTKLGTKHPLMKGTQGFTNKDHSVIKRRWSFFLNKSTLWYEHSFEQMW